MSITVKVIRVPGGVNNVELHDGATVADALRESNTTIGSDEAMKVNAQDANTGTVLRDGDRITIAKGAKGN